MDEYATIIALMSFRWLRLMLGLVLLVCSASALIWGLWPRGLTMDELSASPGVLPSGISLSGFLIKLSWTERVRAGDIGLIRLNFEGKGLDQEYHWVVETRLELAGVRSSPGEDFQSPLMEGQPVAFFWNLDSINTGSYPGKVWVYLRPISARPGQASIPVRRAIAAVPLEVNFSRIFGLDGSAARTLGAVGIVGGLFLFLPPVLPTGKKLTEWINLQTLTTKWKRTDLS